MDCDLLASAVYYWWHMFIILIQFNAPWIFTTALVTMKPEMLYLENLFVHMLSYMNHLIKKNHSNDFTSQNMRVLYNESIHQNE